MPLFLPVIEPYTYLEPANGFSITLGDNVASLVLNPGGLLGSGTIKMCPKPCDGQELNISCSQIITTLVLNPNTGQSIVGGIATLALNGRARFKFIASVATWFRIG